MSADQLVAWCNSRSSGREGYPRQAGGGWHRHPPALSGGGAGVGLTVDGLGRVEVCVRPEDAQAARCLVACDQELEE